MAIESQNANTLLVSLKLLLLSAGVLSSVLTLRMAVPMLMKFMLYELPLLWASLCSWIRPPYLYVLINGIIITIAASSKFQKNIDQQKRQQAMARSIIHQVEPQPDFDVQMQHSGGTMKKPLVFVSPALRVMDDELETKGSKVSTKQPILSVDEEDEDEFVISRSNWCPKRRGATEIPILVTEKPLVSSRIGGRKNAKPSPEGKVLGVARLKRNETLENTWKAITEGCRIPLTRHHKKMETWESPVGKKSGVEGVSSLSPSPGSGKLKKESSLSQDELNKRVEAFIKKFNEDIRLQRQDSFNHSVEMMTRGAN